MYVAQNCTVLKCNLGLNAHSVRRVRFLCLRSADGGVGIQRAPAPSSSERFNDFPEGHAQEYDVLPKLFITQLRVLDIFLQK